MRRFLARLLKRPARAAVWAGAPGASVLAIDGRGRVSAFSPGAGAALGREEAGLSGLAFAALFTGADRKGVETALEEASGARVRVTILGQGGETAPAEISVAKGADGARSALILNAPAAARRPDLAQTAMAARAEAKERADLLADLSHEMKTPLNAVIGFSEAILSETFGPLGHDKYAEYAQHIRASGGHLLDLVTSLLDLSRIEAGRFALHCEMTDIGAVAQECASMVRLSAEKAGLRLVTRIEEDLPESWIDPRALRQILLNLLSNAVKFTSDGEVALEARREGEEIVLTVTDTGVGMSKEDLAKLGARYTAAQGDGVRGAKGTGLGLALAFALAELHGGSLKLDSAPGEGVKASLRLPVRVPQRPRRLEDLRQNAAARARPAPDVLTQLERIEAYRRERSRSAA